ncbi:DDE-type integrase/transposase/recombinase [Roseobacter ponti]|uniref:DDE-type integrase/transposase/recombinase n=1 Tax=Roseobacter ponti TaxID=1891787 RepID=UPI003CCCFD8A
MFGPRFRCAILRACCTSAASKFLRRSIKRQDRPHFLVTDKLRFYRAASKDIGNVERQEAGRRTNNRPENSHLSFR